MKTIKKNFLFISYILLASILVVFAASFFQPKPNNTAYAAETDGGGAGTQSDPYYIGSAATLNSAAMRNNFGTANKYFKLIDDIDLTGITWSPIPSFAAGCIFEGNEKSIKNLTSSSNGLFSKVNGGTIRNLTMKNTNITGGSTVGALAGVATGTITCTNVFVDGGTIKNTSSRTGGFFGQITGAINLNIDKCYVINTMTSTGNSTGGFLGLYESGSGSNNIISIKNSYHIGDITGNSNIVGGIVGGISSGTACNLTIENCFHIGNLNASGYMLGGILAYTNNTGSTANIINCYSSGTVSNGSNATKTGGLYGGYDSGLTVINIVNSYYDSTKYTGGINGSAAVSNINKDGLSAGKTTAEMQSQNFIALLGDGYVYQGGDFPTLKVFGNTKTVTFNYNYNIAPVSKAVTKNEGEGITAADITKPSRIGYVFDEWTEQQDGGGASYTYMGENLTDGTVPVVIDDLNGQTLYAKWTAIQYNLSVAYTGAGSASLSGSNVSLNNKNVIITAAGDNFAYWQVRNKEDTAWVTLNGYSGESLNIEDILNEEFISLYAQDGNNIDFQAVFANTYTITIKSDQRSFGSVTLNGDPIDYDVPAKIVQGARVELRAFPKDYYNFVGYSYMIGTEEKTESTFYTSQDTDVYVTFKRMEFNVLSSSVYSSGNPTLDNTLTALSNSQVKIGDEIQLSYKTNVLGYKFLSLNLLKKDGSYYNLTTDGSGVYYLKVTKGILDDCLTTELEVVAVYLKQYEFFINFDNSKMNNYCEIEVYLEGAAGREYLDLGETHYLDDGINITINLKLNEGFSVGDILGLLGGEALVGEELVVTVSEQRSINIILVAEEFIVFVKAVDNKDDEILEVKFSPDNQFVLEHSAQFDTIEKSGVSGYRFDGWVILNKNGNWDNINSIYVDANNNLLSIPYNYFKDNYIVGTEISIKAKFMPVFTLSLTVNGTGSYDVLINGEKVDLSSEPAQYDYGTTVEINVEKSDYIKFSGFTINGALQDKEQFNLNLDLLRHNAISFDFEAVRQNITVSESLKKANGVMSYTTSGNKDGNNIDANINDNIAFTFNINSGYKLKTWTINELTAKQMADNGYAVYNGNTLTIMLNNDTLDWLKANNMNMDISVKTIFNPLFTAIIIVGAVIIIALLAFIALYLTASQKKKKQIQAAIEAGIIGSARFKSNLVEDAINSEASKDNFDDINN